jgi:hypothetical protein
VLGASLLTVVLRQEDRAITALQREQQQRYAAEQEKAKQAALAASREAEAEQTLARHQEAAEAERRRKRNQHHSTQRPALEQAPPPRVAQVQEAEVQEEAAPQVVFVEKHAFFAERRTGSQPREPTELGARPPPVGNPGQRHSALPRTPRFTPGFVESPESERSQTQPAAAVTKPVAFEGKGVVSEGERR